MRLIPRIPLLLALVLVPARSLAAEVPAPFAGRVVGVADGDTIEVLEGRTPRKVRLWGIDCPEKGQPWGTRARRRTSDLCYGKEVTVEARKVDRYGRLVAHVRLPGGADLSAEVVRAGMAWWYEQYAPKDTGLALLEREARAARRGLWEDADPVPPWVYRRRPPAGGAGRSRAE